MADGIDHRAHRVALGEIGGMDLDRHVMARPDLVACRFERFLGARGDVHGAAFAGEGHGAGEADAAAAAGDQDCLAGELHIHWTFPFGADVIIGWPALRRAR